MKLYKKTVWSEEVPLFQYPGDLVAEEIKGIIWQKCLGKDCQGYQCSYQ